MGNNVGTTVRGIRCPIIREGDDLVNITVDSVLSAAKSEGYEMRDKDIIALTESIVARAQGNYATVDDIAADIKNKYGENATIGVIFPILSRNRFSILLKGIARGCKKIVLMLNYPSDEVGNALIKDDVIFETGINPYCDVLTLRQYREIFGYPKHEFTGVEYPSFYQEIIEAEGTECETIFANQPKAILSYTNNILVCDIHTRKRTKKILSQDDTTVFGLDDILTHPINRSGCNPDYGLLGSNKSTEETIKLFPTECNELVRKIQDKFLEATGQHVEVMVYGDGAFKDPQGGIWELADPVVSPGYTDGLKGTPNELKLKYLADNDFKDLQGEALTNAIKEKVKQKGQSSLVGDMASQGTTPRQYTDLIGSLCDLTSGSGDKGTPIVHIQGYFDNYTS